MGRGLGQQAPTCRAELTELSISSSELWWSSPGLCRAGSTSVGVAESRRGKLPSEGKKEILLGKELQPQSCGL